jgi:hypothetical protein
MFLDMKNFSFKAGSQAVLDIDSIIGKVTVNADPLAKTIDIEVKGDSESLKNFVASQDGDTITLRGPELSGMTIVNGNNVMTFNGGTIVGGNISIGNVTMRGGGRNITVTNGGVWINGKKVDGSADDNTKELTPLDVLISVPTS